jgi:hypothetical protein
MGRILLILLVGFAASFAILARGKEQRFVDSVDIMVDQLTSSTAKNAAASGAYMALNQLYQNPAWRTGYSNLVIGGNALDVMVTNDSVGATPQPFQVKISASAGNADNSNLTEVVVFDRGFQNFAVWAKDTVISATTYDSLGVNKPELLMKDAPFMPKIDKTGLVSKASDQGYVFGNDTDIDYGSGHFHPSTGFPNNSFYHDSTALSQTPNVIYVNGDLHIRDARTVYGIYVVEGDVLLNENATVRGVLYLPNSSSRVYNRENHNSSVVGGIVTWGEVDGEGAQILVRHKPEFLRKLVSNYAPDNPPIRVLSWK